VERTRLDKGEKVKQQGFVGERDWDEVAEKMGYKDGGLGKNAIVRDEGSAEDGRREK